MESLGGGNLTTTPIGRSEYLDKLAPIIRGVGGNQKRGVVLRGPAGVGKTTLLRWAHGEAGKTGALTAHVRAPAAAGLPPRFPIGEFLDGLIRSCPMRRVVAPDPALRVLQTLRGTSTQEPAYPAEFPHIAHAIEQLGALRPVAMFLDDYQWTPREGSDLLFEVLRTVEIPLLFVMTTRDRTEETDASPAIPATSSDLPIHCLDVEGMNEQDMGALAAARLGGPVLPSLRQRLSNLTQGNPLFALETLRSWGDNGALTQIGGHWGIRDVGTPTAESSLENLVAHRLRHLDDEQSTIVNVLAIIGRETSFEVLRSILPARHDALVSDLGQLGRTGIITETQSPSPSYGLAHPLYEGIIRRTLGPTRRAALHGTVFTALSAPTRNTAPVSASELAHHAVHALEPPDNLAELMSSAAEEAMSAGSYREAATWYARLLTTNAIPNDAQARALENQALATEKFDPSAAVPLLDAALNLAPPEHRARLLGRRAYVHRILGNFPDARHDLTAGLRSAQRDEGLLMRVQLAVLSGIQGDIDAAEHALSLLHEECAGEDLDTSVLMNLGHALFLRGHFHNAKRHWESVAAISKDAFVRNNAAANLVWVRILLGEWQRATQEARTEIVRWQTSGDVWNLSTVLCSTGRVEAWRGNFAQALDDAAQAVTLSDRMGNPGACVAARDALGIALFEAGSIWEAVSVLRVAAERSEEGQEARDLCQTFTALAEAEICVCDIAAAEKTLSRAETTLDDCPYWDAGVLRLKALLLRAKGDDEGALETLQDRLERPCLIPFDQARMHELAADLCLASRDKAGFQAQALDALQIYDELGAAPRAARMRDLIARASAKRGRPRSNLPGGITEREVEILRLASKGLTDREIAKTLFISIGTARKHMENLRLKAGVKRRSLVVRWARDQGISGLE